MIVTHDRLAELVRAYDRLRENPNRNNRRRVRIAERRASVKGRGGKRAAP